MITRHNILLFITVLQFSSFTAVAQQQYKAELIGRVVQYNGGAPIPYVNVFLANTTKGSTTNKDGFYRFKGIPFGYYEIVASMMGYEIQSQNIILTKPVKIVINFELHPKVINGFSFLIKELYGPERGFPARSAIGLGSLPFRVPVEIEAIVEIE